MHTAWVSAVINVFTDPMILTNQFSQNQSPEIKCTIKRDMAPTHKNAKTKPTQQLISQTQTAQQ